MDRRNWEDIKRALTGGRFDDRLPERVRASIHEREVSSEILIGWVQLAVVISWTVLYTISPKTFTEEAEFAPIPWVLSAYFAFTLLRLYLAYRRFLPRWFLALSVVSDMALLLVTIWSFHLQYMQPASFYLKAPTLLYVFIFIALRSLRFEVGYVILAGGVGALGWLAMVAYAIGVDPVDTMITRDYVQYLTSNSVLLGAEFDKVISILMVTAILATSLIRARQLLVRAVTEGMAAEDLSRFFAPDVARRITDSETEIAAGRGEFRDATIVYVDIRDFTRLSASLPPDRVMGLLASYEAVVVPIVQRHDGDIDKFLGDGIMATFGATRPDDKHAAKALDAVMEIIVETRRWTEARAASGDPMLRVCAAASAGTILFGAVGDGTRLEYTVIGAAVNLSAKLEKHTKIEHVRALCDLATFDLARAQGSALEIVERRDARAVPGVDEPLDLIVLAS